MTTQIQLMTAEELERLPDDGQRHELVEGVLTTMSPPGNEHGEIAAALTIHLGSFVQANNLGKVIGESGFLIKRNPDTVRAPDAAFTARQRRAPLGRVKGFLPIVPDLAVEVVSPNDLYNEVKD